MAEGFNLGSLAGAGSSALNLFIMIFLVFVLIGLAYVIFRFVKRQRVYKQFDVVIWGKDGFGNITQRRDQAGIFVNNMTKNKRLFLKRNRVGLSPDNIPYIQDGKRKVIMMLQTGLKNFRYIHPIVHNPEVAFTVGEEDVNWGINAYETGKRLFATNPILQYLPFIALGFVTIVILIIFIYFFKNLNVLRDVALSFQEASKNLILARGGTVIGA